MILIENDIFVSTQKVIKFQQTNPDMFIHFEKELKIPVEWDPWLRLHKASLSKYYNMVQ